MVDATPPALPPDSPRHQGADSDTPSGTLRFYWFDGILEASRADAGALADAVDRLSQSGFGQGEVRSEGSRFTLLLDDGARSGEGMGNAQREAFTVALQAILDTIPKGGTAESTLRCTEVFDGGTRESLFASQDGHLRVVARVRARSKEDLDRDPGNASITPPVSLNRRALLLLAALFLAAVGLWAWQEGYLDRLFGSKVSALETEAGPFEGLLELELSSSWGQYVVELSRGSRYPVDPDSVDALVEGAPDLASRSAVNAVANGDEVWVRIEDGSGKVLGSQRAELRKLVSEADATIEVKLPSQIGAKIVRLALSSGL